MAMTISMALMAVAPANGADLWATYQLARDNDPTFQAERSTYQAEQERIPQARAGLRPSLTVSGGRTRRSDDANTNIQFANSGKATFNVDDVSVSVSQRLYDKQRRIAVDQAVNQVQAASLQLDGAEQELLLRVARRYFAVLAASDNLGLARSEKTAIARQLELAQERLAVGLGTQTDLFDAQARFSLAEADEIRALVLLEDARQALVEVTGTALSDLELLAVDAPLLPPDPENVQAWVDQAMKTNIPLGIQRIAVDVAREEITRQRAGRYPVVGLSLSQSYTDSDGSISGPGSERDITDLGVQITAPLFQGGFISASTREALSRHDASLQELEVRQRAALRETRIAYLDVTSGISRVEALDQAVAASESALQAKDEGFAAGLNTNLDVLDAQRDLFRAKRDYLVARYDYILNILTLKQAVGTLSEDDLRRVNTWLDPEAKVIGLNSPVDPFGLNGYFKP